MALIIRNACYYCHQCKRDFNSAIDEYICPNCDLGFVELIDSNNRNEFVTNVQTINSSSCDVSDNADMRSILINETHMIECKQCYICMEEFLIGETVLNLHCTHIYHNECIIPWLTTHNTCPVCRIVINNNPYNTSNVSQQINDYSDDEHDLFDIMDDDFGHQWGEWDTDSDIDHESIGDDIDSDTDSIGSVSSAHEEHIDIENLEGNRDLEDEDFIGYGDDYNFSTDDDDDDEDEPIERAIEELDIEIDGTDSNGTDAEENDEEWFDAHDNHLDELDFGDITEPEPVDYDYDHDFDDNDYVEDDDQYE